MSDGSKIKLRDYQAEAKAAVETSDSQVFLLDHPIGSGKSILALTIADEPILCVVPASLTWQWQAEASKLGLNLTVYEGSSKNRRELFDDSVNLIISYNLFRNDFDFLFKHLKKIPSYTLIFDEAQIIKNPKTKTHKCVLKLKRWTRCKILLLSGTIITKPEDSFGVCKILNPEAYQNKMHWEAMHVKKKDWFGNIEEYKNLDLMKENLYKYAHSVKDEVLNLDEPVIVRVPYHLGKKHLKMYKQLLEDKVLELPDDRVLTLNDFIFAEAQQLVVCPSELGIQGKIINVIKDLISQIGKEKVVIFTRYKKHLHYLADSLGALKYHGEMSSDEKEISKKSFIEDLKQQAIVINIQSGGTGLDGLQHVCHFAIFVDPPLNSPEVAQAIGRLRRSGQKNPVRIWMPYAIDTIQESLVKRLENRIDLYDKISKSDLKKILRIK